MNAKAWIEIESLQLERGGRPVLRGLEAKLCGRAVGLVGANGAGKSTLIGAMLGVLRARSGRLSVLGRALPREAMAVRAFCGVMAEQAGIFPGASGVDAVSFAGLLSGLTSREALRRAHRTLDAMGMGEERYRPSESYSTGMKQKTKLAMCLVHEPRVLILDEPTLGLDPASRRELLSLIKELRERGNLVLLSTHIMQDAELLCDEMLLLEGGCVAYAGPTSELLGRRQETLLARGLGFDEAFSAAMQAEGARAVLLEAPSNARLGEDSETALRSLEFDDTPASLQLFWRLCAQRKVEVRFLGEELRQLEDAVVERMQGGPLAPEHKLAGEDASEAAAPSVEDSGEKAQASEHGEEAR
ncbi:MAG: ABC transporter ATP-binding protein [Myxococcota bacterium]|jgi:ABC-2 type transport system ATP-binding protein|nr:ABC transporter ATP-binding protein [Myxococcota bacterium]